jgi:hypothetical protein
VMLFHMGDLIQDKARTADVLELRVDPDFDRGQFLRMENGILTGAFDVRHVFPISR